MDAAERSEEIYFHQIPDIVRAGFGDGGAHADAGVVDEDVNPPMCRHCAGDELLHVGVARHVARRIGAAGGGNDAGAAFGEESDGFESDAAGGAGDDDDLVSEGVLHFTIRWGVILVPVSRADNP